MSTTPGQFKAACAALARVATFVHPADAALRDFFRDHPKLGPHDRAFVAETVFGVLRHARVIEALAPGAGPRRRALAFWTRFGGWSGREVESLLRPEERDWLTAFKSAEPLEFSLAVRAELPDWVVEKLLPVMAEDDLLALGRGLSAPAPLDLRVNTLLATREEVLERLAADGIVAEPTRYSPTGVRLAGKPAINRHPLYLEGKVEVQDEGSQLLGYLVAPRRGEMVVDFCAGAGGKTLLMGAMMQTAGRLYALDVSDKRLDGLKPRLKRSGLSNVHPQRIDSENDAKVKRLAAKIDRVLVDAPCSGMGTLRRNPDMKWRQSPQSVAELGAKQRTILASAARLLKPGGRLVYATCSLLPEENDAVADEFLAAHPEFAPLDCAQILAAQHIPLDTGPRLRLAPHTHGTDGFFAAAFERAKSDEAPERKGPRERKARTEPRE